MSLSIDEILNPGLDHREKLDMFDAQLALIDSLLTLPPTDHTDSRELTVTEARQRDAAFARQLARTRL